MAQKEESDKKRMKVTIDENAGFCPGVIHAIDVAETKLKEGVPVAALGALIHNKREVTRLKNAGLREVDQEDFEQGKGDWEKLKDNTLLIRAHGISPKLRKKIEDQEISYIDATCARVVRSQKLVAKYYQDGYQVIIVGKNNHPEVKGLLGFCNGDGIIVYDRGDEEKIDLNKKTLLIAQTTVDEERFEYFRKKLTKGVDDIVIKKTICPVVTKKQLQILEFARKNDVIIFVAGKQSSNSKVLFKMCQRNNPRTHFVSSVDELRSEWFENAQSVGITGGASTPQWQLRQVENKIKHDYQYERD